MEFLIKASQLLLSLSILVVLHELGHFTAARIFKTKVEKFYLFFNPWFSLWKRKIGETEYGIGWLPLGGYVKISGMIDESMDKEAMKKPPEPWEFRSKPAWQRLIIMVGGVTVNLLLGMAIYVGVLFAWGKEYLPVENAKYGVMCDSTMLVHGFKDGDMILKVGDKKPETFSEVNKDIIINSVRSVTILRNGEEKILTLPQDIEQLILNNSVRSLFDARFPFEIDSVLPGQPADFSGLLKGDRVLTVNGASTFFFHEFRREIAKYGGQPCTLSVLRNTDTLTVEIIANVNGTIGVINKFAGSYFELKKQEYSFIAAIPAGITHGINTLTGYVSSMKLIFTPAGAKSIGGFGTIGNLFAPQWDWQSFWEMTALLSIILAFMNILPIPALDGGHVIFLLVEMVTGRKPSDKVLEYAQIVGMVLLFTLLIYANGNDILRMMGK